MITSEHAEIMYSLLVPYHTTLRAPFLAICSNFNSSVDIVYISNSLEKLEIIILDDTCSLFRDELIDRLVPSLLGETFITLTM